MDDDGFDDSGARNLQGAIALLGGDQDPTRDLKNLSGIRKDSKRSNREKVQKGTETERKAVRDDIERKRKERAERTYYRRRQAPMEERKEEKKDEAKQRARKGRGANSRKKNGVKRKVANESGGVG